MPAGRKNYSKDFKEEAVKMVLEQGLNHTHVGKKLGVHPTTIGLWLRDHKEYGEKAFPGHGNPKDEELQLLRKEVKRLKMERDFLKKTAIWFAKEQKE